jgi:NitT/TauT family transport system substrate-binding protein
MEPRAHLSRRAAIAMTAAFAAATTVRVRAESTLRVGCTANDTYAEAYYAQDLGLFRKAGLAVDVKTFTNGASVAQAVAGGAIDVGVSNVAQIATAVEHGIPFVYFAGGGLYSSNAPTTALCVGEHGVTTPKQLEGKTLAVSTLKDTSLLATQAWLAQNGVDVAKVQFVEMSFSEMGPALARGTVAGAVISEPSLTVARNGGAKILGKSYDGIAKEFMISGWFTNADFAKKNADAIKHFTQAIYAAGRWGNQHHAESAKILTRYAKLDAAIAQQMTRCTYAQSLDPRLIQPTLDLAARYKLIDKQLPASALMATV